MKSLNTIIMNSSDAIIIFNSLGIISNFNSAFNKLFLYKDKEIIDIHISKLTNNEIKINNEHTRKQIVAVTKYGNEIHIEVETIKFLFEDEIFFMLTMCDISNILQTELDLNNSEIRKKIYLKQRVIQ